MKSKTWKYKIVKYIRRDGSHFYDCKYKPLGIISFFTFWHHQGINSSADVVKNFIDINIEKDNERYSKEIIKKETLSL